MVLVTIGDIEDEAQIRGIDLTKYSKSKLERMIQATQAMIEERTGRIFDKQKKELLLINHHSNVIRLPYSPVFVDTDFEFKIDGIEASNFTLDTQKGLIIIEDYPYFLGKNTDGSFKVEVTYNAGYSPANPIAVELALDILMFNIKGKEVDASIDTVKEGDISIKYAKTGALPADLESRLLALQKPLMEIVYV